jgi:nitroreductase
VIRYIKFSSTYNSDTEKKLLGRIVVHYHVLEKGLSYENMRLGFGVPVALGLVDLLKTYLIKDYDTSKLQFVVGCSVLSKYLKENEKKGVRFDDVRSSIDFDLERYCDAFLGGSKVITKDEILNSANIDFKSFFNSRHSIREFSSEDVSVEKILQAVDIARKYPSVCNRQAIKVYLVTSDDLVKKCLKHQNGNRGFGEKINKLAIIVGDFGLFSDGSERNQVYIDGGIYLMGFLLAIHSQGLGAVALNWSMSRSDDINFRSLGIIKDNETIISFVGMGNLNAENKVPMSVRDNLSDVLTVVE